MIKRNCQIQIFYRNFIIIIIITIIIIFNNNNNNCGKPDTPFNSRYEFKKSGKKVEKVLEKSLENVNKLIEDYTTHYTTIQTLLTDIIDVNHLNDFTYACAIFAIRSANLEKECLISKDKHRK